MGFHSYQMVVARKAHRCRHCYTPINVGEMHRRSAQVFDGQFDAYREHSECFDAWRELNFDLRDCPVDEGAPFLRDDEWDVDDKEWMREKHPLVASRLGWLAASRPSQVPGGRDGK